MAVVRHPQAFAYDSDEEEDDDEEDEEDVEDSEQEEENEDSESSVTAPEESAADSRGRAAGGGGGKDNDNTSVGGKVKGGSASPAPIKHSEESAATDPKALQASSKGNNKHAMEDEPDDHEYLDSIISELASTRAEGEGVSTLGGLTGVSSPLENLLRCDPRCLRLDQELRRKFGGAGIAAADRENGAPGGRARRTRRGIMPRGMRNTQASGLALKRLVVSAPKEGWAKPPSFVGGGLGMRRCVPPSYLPLWQLKAHGGATWFQFEMSSSLAQSEVSFSERRFDLLLLVRSSFRTGTCSRETILGGG